jgi:GNAT superfamily N-acetyltransferase
LIGFRCFHNADPPRLHQLWHSCALGRSAAEGFACDVLEVFSFSQPFFDRKGLIVATDDDRVVGFVHAGFAVNEALSGLDPTQGILSALMVHPGWRRRGIGTELVSRAEQYLRRSGSTNVEAGGGLDRNGFYVGIYGGLQPSGFSADSAPWGEFFSACGYRPSTETVVLRRDLRNSRDPVSARQIRNRRNLKMVISDRPSGQPWWWFVRFGQLDSLTIQLCTNSDDKVVASGQIIGLDVFIPKWGVRSVGVRDVFVPAGFRKHGYAMALLLEICKRLREESVSLIEAHVDSQNDAAMKLFHAAHFAPDDRMLTFRRQLDSTST